MMMKQGEKKKITIVFILLLIISSYCYFMYHNTDSIITDFKDVVTFNENKDINYGALKRYYKSENRGIKITNAHAEVTRDLVYHNFKNGVMYVQYKIMRYDDLGNHVCASRVQAKWYIKKQNGRWIVTAIDEQL